MSVCKKTIRYFNTKLRSSSLSKFFTEDASGHGVRAKHEGVEEKECGAVRRARPVGHVITYMCVSRYTLKTPTIWR